MIGFYLAARHPDRFGHIAISSPATGERRGQGPRPRLRPVAGRGQERRGRCPDDRAMYPGLRVPGVARVAGAALGPLMFGEDPPVLRERRGGRGRGGGGVRRPGGPARDPGAGAAGVRRRGPGLPEGGLRGDRPADPDCTLRMYEGIGHVGAGRDERFPRTFSTSSGNGPGWSRNQAKGSRLPSTSRQAPLSRQSTPCPSALARADGRERERALRRYRGPSRRRSGGNGDRDAAGVLLDRPVEYRVRGGATCRTPICSCRWRRSPACSSGSGRSSA